MKKLKYNCVFTPEAVKANTDRLTNQLWKLIQMRENSEDWSSHLKLLLVEISGLTELYNNNPLYINLLSKLEGLQSVSTEFLVYRKLVFECISLLREIIK